MKRCGSFYDKKSKAGNSNFSATCYNREGLSKTVDLEKVFRK